MNVVSWSTIWWVVYLQKWSFTDPFIWILSQLCRISCEHPAHLRSRQHSGAKCKEASVLPPRRPGATVNPWWCRPKFLGIFLPLSLSPFDCYQHLGLRYQTGQPASSWPASTSRIIWNFLVSRRCHLLFFSSAFKWSQSSIWLLSHDNTRPPWYSGVTSAIRLWFYLLCPRFWLHPRECRKINNNWF